MIIYTVCVNPESGKYLAISASDPTLRAIAYSEAEALADLIKKTPGITIDAVVCIETTSCCALVSA